MPAAAAPAAAAIAAPAPAAAAPAAAGSDVVDPTESRRVQAVQRQLHDTRVRLVRAATRLGLTSRNEQVAQFLQVGRWALGVGSKADGGVGRSRPVKMCGRGLKWTTCIRARCTVEAVPVDQGEAAGRR